MPSTTFIKHNSSPIIAYRTHATNENTDNGSQRRKSRRSLSDRLRDLFRKSSSSPDRRTDQDRNTSTTSIRQSSASPRSTRTSTEATRLHSPIIRWPFGKKKGKLSTAVSTPAMNKTKTKTKRFAGSNIEISNPIYSPNNQTTMYGQNFVPKTPESVRENSDRTHVSTNYDGATTKDIRHFVTNDPTQQSQQVVMPDIDVFITPAHTSERNRSPYMNTPRLSNRSSEYQNYNENVTVKVSMPLAEIEINSTPQRKRKADDSSSLSGSRIITEKPPIGLMNNSSRPPSTVPTSVVITNPVPVSNTSSTTINSAGRRSTASPSREIEIPPLNAPSVKFGSVSSKSSKKNTKRDKSKDAKKTISGSSTTISNLMRQNPLQPNQSWSTTYGSLPDVTFVDTSGLVSRKPPPSPSNKYPYISAIVQHHVHSDRDYDNVPPSKPTKPGTTTTTGTTTGEGKGTTVATTTPVVNHRPPRFETSTTTLGENEMDEQRHSQCVERNDGYIRPMTPQPAVQVNVSVSHIDRDGISSPPTKPTTYPSRCDDYDPSAIYRSSTTIYTRDKNQLIDGGEIKTWSSQENAIDNETKSICKPPFTHAEIDRIEHHMEIPIIKGTDNYKRDPTPPSNDQEFQEEEYEVSYEFERVYDDNFHGKQIYRSDLRSANYISNEVNTNKNIDYSTLPSRHYSPMITERESPLNQTAHSYTGNEYIQEQYSRTVPANNYQRRVRHYTLKRSDSYDGIGISLSADSHTRLNHFIREVEPGSPGFRAGLRSNDILIAVNGTNVENIDFNDVLILIKHGLENDNLQLSVIHEHE